MPTSETRPAPQPAAVAGVSMRELLAACAAAHVVSTPPRAPEPEPYGTRPSGSPVRPPEPTLPPAGREAA